VFLNEATNEEYFLLCYSLFLFAFSSFNISVFSYELSPAPTQVVLEDKEPEKLYYFDPLPTFSYSGTLNEINAIVYEMGEVISGSINEKPNGSMVCNSERYHGKQRFCSTNFGRKILFS